MSALESLILKHHRPGFDISAVCLQRSEVSTQTQAAAPAAPVVSHLAAAARRDGVMDERAAAQKDFTLQLFPSRKPE